MASDQLKRAQHRIWPQQMMCPTVLPAGPVHRLKLSSPSQRRGLYTVVACGWGPR